MTKKKLISFCEYFYASHFIPVSLIKNDELVIRCCSDNSLPDFYIPALEFSKNTKTNPCLYVASYGKYGIIKNGNYTLIIGPVLGSVLSQSVTSGFIHAHASYTNEKAISEFLSNIPSYSHNRFLNLISLIHLQINNEEIDIINHFNISNEANVEKLREEQTEYSYQAKENQIVHGTYFFEKQLIDVVKGGNVAKLKLFFSETLKNKQLNEGVVADNPLRQAKNLLIGVATQVSRNAAIPGGIDVEEAYRMTDIYIQECEKCQSIQAVKTLQYNMLVDFTEKIGEVKMPSGISDDVFKAVQYIKLHTNALIGVTDVVEAAGISKNWLNKKFREQLNTTVGKYITFCKIEESKSFLAHSDKSISEISNYFYFSSQSYFQNLFKKQYGITPANYRKKHSKKMGGE